jgi:nitrite reductase/ring-hydroxylating ferredoxin subunit/uncharacterized membrane protein
VSFAVCARAVVDRIGRWQGVEKPASQAAELVRPLVEPDMVKNALSGVWLGHRLHPALTDVVIGSWLSAGLFDLVGGAKGRESSDLLVRAGLVAAIPTAVSGLSDYTDLYDHGRRVAFVHLLAVDAAAVLQVASVVARRRGRHGLGVGFSAAAVAVVSGASWLGGHLSYVLGVGVDHTAFDEGPKDWVSVAASRDIGADPTVVGAGEHEVLLVRTDEGVVALANRCSHAGWPIGDGEVSDGCITCPAHGSRFRLSDGTVMRGPAASSQLRYDAREVDGQVQVRGSR